MKDPVLFIMLGYPGSGKSTFARQLARALGVVRLSSDDLRSEMFTNPRDIQNMRNNTLVFGALNYAMKEVLARDLSVIYDVNNNKIAKRKKLHQLAAKHNAKSVIVWVKVFPEVAKDRETQRAKDPNYVAFPPGIHDNFMNALQAPTETEPTIVIDGTESFEEQLASFHRQSSDHR